MADSGAYKQRELSHAMSSSQHTQTQTDTHTNTPLCPFPAFLTLILSPGIPAFSSIYLPSSPSFPIAPHLPFSPLLHSHGSLQQQLPGVLRSNPQHGGCQVQGAERTQVLRDTGWGGSRGWAGLPPVPATVGLCSVTGTFPSHPCPLGGRGGIQ